MSRRIISKGRKLAWAEIIAGIFLLIFVSVIAVNSDLSVTQTRLYDTVTYIKEQCNNNLKLDIASESKSLMRIIESVDLLNWQISEADKEADTKTAENAGTGINKEFLEEYATMGYLTGAAILDENGQVQMQYCSDDVQVEELLSYVDSDAFFDVVNFKEKTYSMRVERQDGSYIDLAAIGRPDQPGIVMVYYHTPERYTRIFNHSINALLSGYSLEHNGTIVISEGNQIVASNNKELIGTKTDC